MTALANIPDLARPRAPAREDELARILATFDAAYDTTWPAQPGQFWADRYPPGAAPYANLVHARNTRVRELARPGESLLDVGSGYGDLLFLLRDRFESLRGVDPSNTSCAMATYNLVSREVANDFRFVVGLAESLPFAAASFDTVTMLDTFEHVEPSRRADALGEARRALKPGGQLILVTPSRRMLKFWALIDNLLSLRGQMVMRRKHGHAVRVFGLPTKTYCEVFTSPRELKRDLRAAGFTVERFERVSFYPAPERGGFFYKFFEHLPADHPRVRRAMKAVSFFERLGFFSQKMLVVARPNAAHASSIRPAADFHLPVAYRQQPRALTHDTESNSDYWTPERVAASGKWQHHVYDWAARLVRDRGLKSVLDVGCGPGTKLARLIAPVCSDIEGIDQPSAIAAAARLDSPGRYTEVDLERCGRTRAWRTFDLIICADVIEHLLDPDPMLDLIRRFCHPRTLVLLSTPDRARLRGRACMASEKPEHVREWTAPEFTRYLRSCRFAVDRVRLLPGDDAPIRAGTPREMLWRARLVRTSPHRCLTVLCRPGAG